MKTLITMIHELETLSLDIPELNPDNYSRDEVIEVNDKLLELHYKIVDLVDTINTSD